MNLYEGVIQSPIGELYLFANDSYLLMIEFNDSEELKAKKARIQKIYNSNIRIEMNTILLRTKMELLEYFQGIRKEFSIPIHTHGTEFQEKAWKALREIPYGETYNYLQEATLIGKPKAVRAIGGANHNNPVVIIIPCHRVIGKSGKLVGYGGGIERKIWLLEHEKKHTM